MTAKRDRRGNRWTDAQKAEALEAIEQNGGDTKAAERVLLARHGRGGTPSERQLRRWRDEAAQPEASTAPVSPPEPLEDAEPIRGEELLQEAAQRLREDLASKALSPSDRARASSALATVAAKIDDREPKRHRELRIAVAGAELSEEEVQPFLRWLKDHRRRGAEDFDIVAELDGIIGELVGGLDLSSELDSAFKDDELE